MGVLIDGSWEGDQDHRGVAVVTGIIEELEGASDRLSALRWDVEVVVV